jgi:bacterioferritin
MSNTEGAGGSRFLSDIQTLRARARKYIDEGAVTAGYRADRDQMIDSYREMVDFIGDNDPTTRRMLEEILGAEEQHANDLASLLARDLSLERRRPL